MEPLPSSPLGSWKSGKEVWAGGKGNGNPLGYLITLGRLRIIMGKNTALLEFSISQVRWRQRRYAAVEPLRQGEKSSWY